MLKRIVRKFSKTQFFHNFDFEYLVVGGGSAGTSLAEKLGGEGKEVCLVDYVTPSPLRGTQWSVGGTCINVGCIPKKLYHYANNKNPVEWTDFGYQQEEICPGIGKDWEMLMNNVEMYIRSLNFQTRATFMNNDVVFKNKFAKFVDRHTMELGFGDEDKEVVTAKNIILANGLRPKIPNIEGKKYGITSDDFFKTFKDPGKTLIIGGSYIALECAGLLEENATVMVRSLILRDFDRSCADFILEDMKEYGGINFLMETEPKKIVKDEETGKLIVTYQNQNGIHEEEFDTVLFAIGREPNLEKMDIDVLNLDYDEKGKIIVDDLHRTKVKNIYALGDINNKGLELTPVAAKQGEVLSNYFLTGDAKVIDYTNIPTTVFTPLEYGTVGLSEEEAIEKFGEDRLVIYDQKINLLEYSITAKHERSGFVKLICDKEEDEKVVGFHFISPNASEMTQIVSTAMNLGMTKQHLDDTFGIHPTYAEKVVGLRQEKKEDSGC